MSLILPAQLIAKGCESLYQGQQVTPEQMNEILAQHRSWLKETEQREKLGERANYQDKRRANLCGAKLAGMNLPKANLSRANLKNVDLSQAKLIRAKLHQAWLDDAILHQTDLWMANLSQAYLYGANLSHANLTKANLSKAALIQANLNHAKLKSADLSGATLIKAQLISADLGKTNLSNTELSKANLSNAKLQSADLSKADLSFANLSGAFLFGTILKDTTLYQADLNHTIFFPKPGALPDIITFKATKNYQNMIFYDGENKFGAPFLTELRAASQKVGMRDLEREITYMLKKQQQQENWEQGGWGWIDSVFSMIFFEWTCAYGLKPQRPLLILLSSILFFGFIYWFGLRTGFLGAKVEVIWASKVLTGNEKRGIKKGAYGPDIRYPIRLGQAGTLRSEWRLLRVSFHLSILSAFHIGWRYIDVGTWIKRLQRREYSLEVPRGWMRRLCGFQSLMSVYMVALWAMTQFGRPFE
jgi:uncharacterized protein YjbI with pentapeptide repeats